MWRGTGTGVRERAGLGCAGYGWVSGVSSDWLGFSGHGQPEGSKVALNHVPGVARLGLSPAPMAPLANSPLQHTRQQPQAQVTAVPLLTHTLPYLPCRRHPGRPQRRAQAPGPDPHPHGDAPD